MGIDAVTAWLSRLPPQQWAQAQQRAAIIEDYLRIENPSAEDAHRHATRLGLQMRMFYNLVRIFKEAGDNASPAQRTRRSSIDPRTAEAIEAAIAELGPGAIESDVMALAIAKCTAVGAPAPSSSAVRTRFGRRAVNPNVATRINRDGDLVLDGVPLSIDVMDASRRLVPANLCALVHIPSGAILSHKVVAGSPVWEDALETLHGAATEPLPTARRGASSLKLLASSGVGHPPDETAELLSAAGIDFDPSGSRHLRRGAALIATLGLRLGRIRLLPHRQTSSSRGRAEPTDIAHVASVIALLIQERNETLTTNPPSDLRELLQACRYKRLQQLLVSHR